MGLIFVFDVLVVWGFESGFEFNFLNLGLNLGLNLIFWVLNLMSLCFCSNV